MAAWNQARALLSDTCPIRQESAYQCEKYGVFANDIRMVRMLSLIHICREYGERHHDGVAAEDGFFRKRSFIYGA